MAFRWQAWKKVLWFALNRSAAIQHRSSNIRRCSILIRSSYSCRINSLINEFLAVTSHDLSRHIQANWNFQLASLTIRRQWHIFKIYYIPEAQTLRSSVLSHAEFGVSCHCSAVFQKLAHIQWKPWSDTWRRGWQIVGIWQVFCKILQGMNLISFVWNVPQHIYMALLCRLDWFCINIFPTKNDDKRKHPPQCWTVWIQHSIFKPVKSAGVLGKQETRMYLKIASYCFSSGVEI